MGNSIGHYILPSRRENTVMVSWEIWEVDNLNLLAVVVYLFMFGNNNVMNVGEDL